MINVLLVEDEWLMMVGLKSMIDWEEFGFRIVGEASNGKEALEIMRKTPVDLLITDIKMPVMNGIELIKETEKTFDQCEYLILSCLDEFSYVKDALKLGVSDYLIKSDINKDRLIEVLDTVKKKIEEGRKQRYEHMKLVGDYKKSLGYFKQALFKEVISGLKRSEELQSQKDALKICLESAPLIVLKIMLDDFQQLRKKYVEKDEMLLRFSIMNILQEIIPGENKEIVVENSAEYVAAVNVEGDEDAVRLYAHQLCRRIMNTLKDFMNISVSIGVSRAAPGFEAFKNAYDEADTAARQRFFRGGGKVIDFEDATMFPSDHEEWHLDRSIKERLRVALDTLQLETCKDHLRRIRQQMVNGRLTEQAVRKTYIRILEMINAHFPTFQYSNEEERTPYEELLAMETIEAIHAYIERFLEAGFNHIEQLQPDQKSYVEQAVDIIMKRYAENISLHSVADQINVNRSYLSRMFKKETGENFTTFLTKVRIEKAKYYLNAGNLKVYEIAEKVGYLNYTYFSKIFKKVVGMSPEEYRG